MVFSEELECQGGSSGFGTSFWSIVVVESWEGRDAHLVEGLSWWLIFVWRSEDKLLRSWHPKMKPLKPWNLELETKTLKKMKCIISLKCCTCPGRRRWKWFENLSRNNILKKSKKTKKLIWWCWSQRNLKRKC